MTGETDGFCAIALLMYGDSLSIDEVSALTGLTPTRTRITPATLMQRSCCQ